MKKNGFIATSILYSFFLVFITLFVALITNYLHNQVLLSAIDEQAWETLYSINNTKFSDLEVGEHIKFANIPSPKSSYSYTLNENATWVVAHIVPISGGTKKRYYLLSDFAAQNSVVTRWVPGDPPVEGGIRHAVTIDVMNHLSSTTRNDGYKDDIYFYVSGSKSPNNVFTSNDFKVYIPRASILAEVRKNDKINDNIKDEILGVNGDYAIYVDSTSQGGFNPGTYVLLRRYNFPMRAYQSSLVEKYCAATYDGTKVTYTGRQVAPGNYGANTFGYTHVVDESVNKSGQIGSYVDYCTYASPISYTHSKSENVVDRDESKDDIIKETFRSMPYQYRLMAEITVDINSEYTYVSGGRGTALDPYLMTTGGKVS